MTTTVHVGDCRDILPTLPEDRFSCVVTSPPYWKLRSYLADDHADKHLEIGSEDTVEEWIDTLCGVFRQVKRVLRPDGVMFLNVGDSMAGARRGGVGETSTLKGGPKRGENASRAPLVTASRRRDNAQIPRSDLAMGDVKNKEMVGQPYRLVLALRSGFAQCGHCDLELRGNAWPIWHGERVCIDCIRDGYRTNAVAQTDPGWYWRQDIIWRKPNAMPESARDRPTREHEYVYLLSKRDRYYWNFTGMREASTGGAHPRKKTTTPVAGWAKGPGDHSVVEHNRAGARRPKAWDVDMGSHRTLVNGYARQLPGVNPKAVTNVAGSKQNASFSEAISTEVVKDRNCRTVWDINTHAYRGSHFATFPPALAEKCIKAGCAPGGEVLDPFGGAGTTALAANRLVVDCTCIELDARAVQQTRDRLGKESSLFGQVQHV